MKMLLHSKGDQTLTEIQSESVVVDSVQSGLELIMSISSDSLPKVILHQNSITPEFFNLKSGLAGEILQKFVNYRFQVAIVGQFDQFMTDSFKAFMIECNRGKQCFFVSDVEMAKDLLFERQL